MIPPWAAVPPGSQDLLGADVRRRRWLQRTFFGLAEARGYAEVIPPTFEYEEVFVRAGGPELAARLIRFFDRDGRVVALRADFTAAIARIAATRLVDAPLPLRLCYAGKVYRQEPDGVGRQRELFQMGAELIGAAGPEADLEVLRLTLAAMRAFGLENFRIDVGDTRFVRPLLAGADDATAAAVRRAIAQRNPAALATATAGLPAAARRALGALPELVGRADTLAEARRAVVHPEQAAALDHLEALADALTDDERARVVFDLGEVRGLDYYTGLQFELFVEGFGRAVGYGGRYDDLLALYGAARPAIGFALETDALAACAPSREP